MATVQEGEGQSVRGHSQGRQLQSAKVQKDQGSKTRKTEIMGSTQCQGQQVQVKRKGVRARIQVTQSIQLPRNTNSGVDCFQHLPRTTDVRAPAASSQRAMGALGKTPSG